MTLIDIILVGISLSMDAFAISLCKGLTIYKNKIKKCIVIGLYFGIFQAIMPIVGYLLANNFKFIIQALDHWIAFFLLTIIGIKMIKDAIMDENDLNDSTKVKVMLPLALATSIDALVVGITLTLFDISLFKSISIIGIITFILTFIGSLFASYVSNNFGRKSQIIGGLMIIVIGLKILFEHLNLI